jgi:hypothetical protein
MTFARNVFAIAAIWGVAVLTPFYWLADITGHRYPAPTEYPQFFYGFFGVALVWQLAFVLIATNPSRYRPLMLVAAAEKASYVLTVTVLYAQNRIGMIDVQGGLPDGILGILFVIAFVREGRRGPR